ncbi:MAG: class I SAM-dependent methyltransferase [Bacteroidales bacterium]
MKYLSFLIRVLVAKVDILFALHLNRHKYNKNMITEFEYSLRRQFLKTNQQFGTTDFYQNYPPLMISGKRDSLCRFAMYGLSQKVNSNTMLLDIGGNIGFFSAYISQFVKQVDIVEQNKSLTQVCKQLLKHQAISNVDVYNADFKEFTPNKKYDIVFSLAIHKWVELDFQEYLNKIRTYLNTGGLLLMESHLLFSLQGEDLEPQLKRCEHFELVEKGQIDDHEGAIREFFWLKAL